ncbi:hypothetical protein PTTG_27404 [Puccinia triticina 1-1 BBBD Race 1]|uniref:Uncharacterized protein n=1 Tax=Puccinia triticina (isolate 1-1 / race 1 (BBBD)) TaxID=630390 RepID=A0A180GKY5_PUCT1|nr:hypothetical protein PTTG_27404 [Puccinia triticina 1-1 BBBD Race 1]
MPMGGTESHLGVAKAKEAAAESQESNSVLDLTSDFSAPYVVGSSSDHHPSGSTSSSQGVYDHAHLAPSPVEDPSISVSSHNLNSNTASPQNFPLMDSEIDKRVASFQTYIESIAEIKPTDPIYLKNWEFRTICKARTDVTQDVDTLTKLYRILIEEMWKSHVTTLCPSPDLDYKIEFERLFGWLKMQMFTPEEGLPIHGWMNYKDQMPWWDRFQGRHADYNKVQTYLLRYFSQEVKPVHQVSYGSIVPELLRVYSDYVRE